MAKKVKSTKNTVVEQRYNPYEGIEGEIVKEAVGLKVTSITKQSWVMFEEKDLVKTLSAIAEQAGFSKDVGFKALTLKYEGCRVLEFWPKEGKILNCVDGQTKSGIFAETEIAKLKTISSVPTRYVGEFVKLINGILATTPMNK